MLIVLKLLFNCLSFAFLYCPERSRNFLSEIYPVIGLHEMSESYRLYFLGLFFYNSIKLVF